jgi:hypothetical protein
MPEALEYGLSSNNVTLHSLQPWDTRASKGFITTLCLMYIKKDLFDELDLQRRTPGSKLLNNPDASIAALMNLTDPTVPLLASSEEATGDANGQITDDTTSGSDDNSSTSDGTSSGSPIDNASGTISTKSVGIGAGVVAGALAYGGAMFFVARRYRQRRNRHSRASSMTGGITPNSGPGGPPMGANPMVGTAMMHGARATYGTAGSPANRGSGANTSARGPISGPLMAANSLGWS